MRDYQRKLQSRSYRKDHIRGKTTKPINFSPKQIKNKGFKDYYFILNTFETLSNTQKGLLIITALLLVGGGVAIASGRSWIEPDINIATLALRQKPSCLPQVHGVRGVQQAFFSQPALPKVYVEDVPKKPILFYKGFIVKDVSRDISHCEKKTHGLSAGKICDIGGIRHYLKVVETENAHPGRKTNSLLGIYNLALLRNSLSVTVPSVFMAFEKDGSYPADIEVVAPASFYVASKTVQHFETGRELIKKIHRQQHLYQIKNPFLTQNLSSIKREQIVAKIGEHGLAKLAVAGTFFQDLVNNDGNWGFDNRGLVIIDVDNSPATLQEYLAEAARMPGNIELDFSMNTIIAMKKNYLDMLQKELPVIHHSVDMKGIFYQALVKIYIEACNRALMRIREKYPTLLSHIPTPVVNDILSESFLEAMDYARKNNFFQPAIVMKSGRILKMVRPVRCCYRYERLGAIFLTYVPVTCFFSVALSSQALFFA